jgi:hypothetical protein
VNLQSILDSLNQLVQNPASNIVASSLGFAIVVVVVLILIMIILVAVMPRSTTRGATGDTPMLESTGLGRASGARARRNVLLAALALVAVAGAYVTSGTNAYCSGTCHTMVTAGSSWAASSHATTPCVRCHESSPVDAVPTRTRHFLAELLGTSGASRRAAVSSRRCLGCHKAILKGTITSTRGVRIEHAHVIKAGTDCLRCHEATGHSTGPSTRRGTMGDCLRCHDGEQALAACFICHEGDIARAALTEHID